MKQMIPVLILTCAASAASAQSPIAEVICAPSDQMTQKLRTQFGASQTAIGIRNPEEVMEVWTDDRGEWTLVMTYASGKSCIVAMGEDWIDVPRPQDPA